MGHPGKHIIDPETGLCELCDEDAIQQVHQGKRPGKQMYYSNHDDRPMYRSNNEIPDAKDRYVHEIDDEPRPRYSRKVIYPAPTVRPRRAIYEQSIEEPIIVRKKYIRRDRTPPEEVIIHRRPAPRTKTLYYADSEGQLVPEQRTPPPESHRRYVVPSKHLPPAQPVRIVRRTAQTPPLPESPKWHTRPTRQIKSDTEVIEREQQARRHETEYRSPTPVKPEMYYIESIPTSDHHSPPDSPMYMSHDDNNTPPPKVMYPSDRNRKQNRVEPLERKNPNPPEPAIVRRVYKKLPPGKHEPPNDQHGPNEYQPRSLRSNDRNPPPLRQNRSLPPSKNRNNRSPEPAENPSIYYMRSVDNYQ